MTLYLVATDGDELTGYAATSIVVYPLYAVAAVLITLHLLGGRWPLAGPCETRAPR
jgi:hypothetical protein